MKKFVMLAVISAVTLMPFANAESGMLSKMIKLGGAAATVSKPAREGYKEYKKFNNMKKAAEKQGYYFSREKSDRAARDLSDKLRRQMGY